jgi:signal transduction histidine kinase
VLRAEESSRQALTNLLENALRHSPAPGSVELEVEQTTSDLIFRVLDRGTGIAPGDVPRLFEPFYRPAERRDGAGSGLGLAIARSIAEAQGGRITYAPRRGGGSAFELHLPSVRLDQIG